MTKITCQTKRFLSLLMTLAMMLTLLVPTTAVAAGGYDITIQPNDYTLTPENVPADEKTALAQRFTAYEIFKGVLSDLTPSQGGAPNQGQLADVEWGSGIKAAAYSDLLIALTEINNPLNGTDGLGITGSLNDLAAKYDTTGFALSSDTTLGALFKRALEKADYGFSTGQVTPPADGILADSAAVIAVVISELNDLTSNKNNAALANAFAKVLAKTTTVTNDGDPQTTTATYDFLDTQKGDQSKWTPANGDKGHWTIDVPDAGYYLVLDGYSGSPDQDEISKYILAVFGQQTIQIKSDAANVEKDIVLDNDTLAKGTSEEIGETVTFRLTGELPENYEGYNTFTYKFMDHMSKGLTLNENSIRVYAVKPGTPATTGGNGEETPAVPDTWYELADVTGQATTDTGYTVEKKDRDAANNKDEEFTVSFTDMKKVTNGKLVQDGSTATDDTTITITKDWKIIVEYTATVTPDAVVVDPAGEWTGDDGRNYNNVRLEYSNDVNDSSSTARTPVRTVYVYIYGENVDKVDGTKDDQTQNALAGAGFALKKTVKEDNDNVVYYAVFEKNSSEEVLKDQTFTIGGKEIENQNVKVTTYTYTLVGWVAASELDADGKLAPFPKSDKTWVSDTVSGAEMNTEGLKKLGVFKNDAEKKYYLAFETVHTDIFDANADKAGEDPAYEQEILLIQGLEDGTYTFTEKLTPFGYDTMKDVEFTVNETIDNNGNLTELGANATDTTRNDAIFTAESTSGNILTTLKNMPSGYLPGTGGMGTVLFYIGGVIMLALGALYILRRRNRRAAV